MNPRSFASLPQRGTARLRDNSTLTPNTGGMECEQRRAYDAAAGLTASAPLAAPRVAATGLPVAGFACTAFLNGFIGFDARLACLTTAVELACGVVPVVPATTTAVVSTGWENDVSCVGAWMNGRTQEVHVNGNTEAPAVCACTLGTETQTAGENWRNRQNKT